MGVGGKMERVRILCICKKTVYIYYILYIYIYIYSMWHVVTCCRLSYVRGRGRWGAKRTAPSLREGEGPHAVACGSAPARGLPNAPGEGDYCCRCCVDVLPRNPLTQCSLVWSLKSLNRNVVLPGVWKTMQLVKAIGTQMWVMLSWDLYIYIYIYSSFRIVAICTFSLIYHDLHVDSLSCMIRTMRTYTRLKSI